MICFPAFAALAGNDNDTLTVYFRQGKATVELDYMGNDSAVAKIDSIIKASGSPAFPRVAIRGAASPEGTVGINRKLSRERALAVAKYFDIPNSVLTTCFSGIDWAGLQSRVEFDLAVPFKGEVEAVIADIVKSPDKTRRGDVLRTMHSGVPYGYLFDRHFPFLRTSQIVVEPVVAHTGAAADTVTAIENSYAAISMEGEATPEEDAIKPVADATVGVRTAGGYIFAIKTNMLYDGALIPNIGVEFAVGRHFSVGGSWMYAWWKNRPRNRHWRIYGGDITARYWFGGGARSLNGHHVGIYGTVLLYQVAFGGKGYISGIPGEGLAGGKPWTGGGVEYGYSLNVHPRLNIDFSLGAGYTSGEQRDYRMIDGCYVWQSSSRRHWYGPTKAEISLVWKIGKLPPTAKKGKEVRQ